MTARGLARPLFLGTAEEFTPPRVASCGSETSTMIVMVGDESVQRFRWPNNDDSVKWIYD